MKRNHDSSTNLLSLSDHGFASYCIYESVEYRVRRNIRKQKSYKHNENTVNLNQI